MLMVLEKNIQAELSDRLVKTGWEVSFCKKTDLVKRALEINPDFLLIQSDNSSMSYRGILISLHESGCSPYIIFFDLAEHLTIASSKTLEEPFVSLHLHRQSIIDTLYESLEALGTGYSDYKEFAEDDYINITSMTFKRGEYMREMLSGLRSEEFYGIANKLNLPFEGSAYYLLVMATPPEFILDYRNNRRVYYLLEVLKAKHIWSLLESPPKGILFRATSRNSECVLFNAPDELNSRASTRSLKSFLNAVYTVANDGVTAFVLSSRLSSPEQIHDAYQACVSALDQKIFYMDERILTLDTIQTENPAISSLERADAVIQQIRNFDIGKSTQILKEHLDYLFLTLIKVSKSLSTFHYCKSALDLILNHFYTRYSVEKELLGPPVRFAWNRSLEDYSEQYLTLFTEAQNLAMESFHLKSSSINKAIHYIHNHYGDVLSLKVLAKVAGLNPSYFSRKFKNNTNVNFSTYIESYRLEIAKQLLVSTDKKVYEIASEVGYPDVRIFAKVFKKHTGLSPTQYSKR
jgi:AraC-like DNA-binding protein